MSFIKNLFTIAFPIITQNFLSSFVNMLDTIMVGQLGAVDIAAVGLSNQIFFLMNMLMFGIVSGGSIFMAQFWGKKDIKGLHRTMGITLSASIVIALIFFVAGFFLPELCLQFYTKDVEVIYRGVVYLRAVSPSYFFTGIVNAYCHALRSTEKVKLPMIATTISVIINGILNYILMFGISTNGNVIVKPYGILGAAIATDIARGIEFLIIVAIAYKQKFEVAVNPINYFKNGQSGFFSKYIKICIPVLINESLWGFGISCQNSIFAHAGTAEIAAFNITATIFNLIWTFFIGCGSAASIMIGKTIGQQKIEEAKSLAKKLCKFMAIAGAVLSILIIPLTLILPFAFNVEPKVIKMANVLLYITMGLFPMYAIGMCMVVGVCRSGGDTIFCLIMDVGFMWSIAIPLGFCAVNFWHLPYWAIFLCIHADEIFKTVLGINRLNNGKWLHDVTV